MLFFSDLKMNSFKMNFLFKQKLFTCEQHCFMLKTQRCYVTRRHTDLSVDLILKGTRYAPFYKM